MIFHDILDTNDRFCLIRNFSDKASLKKQKKKEKSKIGSDSSLEKHVIVPESLIEHSYRLPFRLRKKNKYRIIDFEMTILNWKPVNINGFQLCTVGGVEANWRRVTGRRDNANRLTRGLLLSHVVSEGFRDIRDTTTFCSRHCELPCMIKSGVAQFIDFS